MACVQKMGEGIFCLDIAVVGWLGGGGKQDERMKLLLILLFPALPAMRMQSRGPEDWNIQPQRAPVAEVGGEIKPLFLSSSKNLRNNGQTLRRGCSGKLRPRV